MSTHRLILIAAAAAAFLSGLIILDAGAFDAAGQRALALDDS